MGIRLSIILPSLNVADYIEEAVRSVMNQTLKEIEIICIDAGSDDGTWKILSGLAAEDERIVLCRSDKRSYGYQVNMGLDMAQGEYVAILETDDYVVPEMYGRLYEEAVKRDCEYVKSDCFAYWTQDNGERFFFKKRIFVNDDLYDKILEPKKHFTVATEDWYLWNGIYKKEFLTKNEIRLSETPGAAFQDIGFIFWTNVYATRALYLKDVYYRYCIDREGASTNSGKGLKYSYGEFSRLCEILETRGETDEDVIRSMYCRMAKSFVCCYMDISKGSIDIADSERTQCYRWFREKLQSALERGIIDRAVIQPGVWSKLEVLLTSEENYIEGVKAHDAKIRNEIGAPGDFPIVIFGCGSYGYSAYKWLSNQEYDILNFMDNNKALWGTKVNGITVESPQKADTLSDSVKYLIANELYSGDIKAQLLSLGVLDENICIYV
ncbi:MAG: glycosyltransferase [Lachnospiraceae bacterium]|nr:glycosyltransferase [Lachnospiraceae bacterium]